ncbi:hypothetical protein WA158_007475 [Blastocystis sp. Blastoise]
MGNCVSSSDFAVDAVSQQPMGFNESDELATFATSTRPTLYSKASLAISCNNLPKLDKLSESDAFVVVYEEKNGQYVEIGRTEVVVDCKSPKFVRHINLLYQFETIQHMKFVIYDADKEASNSENLVLSEQDLIGQVKCTLAEVVNGIDGFNASIECSQREQSGTIHIDYEEIQNETGKLNFNVQLSGLKCEKEILVYKSECQINEPQLAFNALTIDSFLLANNQFESILVFDFYEFKKGGDHKHIGQVQTTVNELIKKTQKDIVDPKEMENTIGSFIVNNCQYKPSPSFLKYIKNGLELNFMVAIDFTASNGDPRDYSSLHYMRDINHPNSYESAILGIGNVLEYYDKDCLFPTFGFGGEPRGTNTANHCFALNMNEQNPDVHGVEGILRVYKDRLMDTELSGPTYFQPVINKALQYSSECLQYPNKYMVLLIITDGEIHDMQKTIQTIVNGSTLPLSIIIVGVGHADFTSMEILDGDSERLHYTDHYAQRDLVQFLPLNELKDQSQVGIAKQFLQEIPTQVCSYMELKQYTPEYIFQVSHQDQPIPTNMNITAVPSSLPSSVIPVLSSSSPLPSSIPIATPINNTINNTINNSTPLYTSTVIPTATPIPVGNTTIVNSIPIANVSPIPIQPNNI